MRDTESQNSDKINPLNTSSGWNERYLSDQGLAVPGTFTHSDYGNQQFYRVKFRAIDRCLKRIDSDLLGKTIVDVAGGSGQFVDFFLRRGAREVLVTDFSKVALQHVRQRYKNVRNVTTMLFDMKSIDHTWHDHYDFAFVMEAVFLLVTDNHFAQAIRNLSAALKHGGYLIISDLFPTQTIQQNAYVIRRSRSEFEEVMAKNGLTTVGYVPQTFLFNRRVFGRFQYAVEKTVGPLLYWSDVFATSVGWRPPPNSPSDVKYLIAKRVVDSL